VLPLLVVVVVVVKVAAAVTVAVVVMSYQLPCFGFQFSFICPQSSIVILCLRQLLLDQMYL